MHEEQRSADQPGASGPPGSGAAGDTRMQFRIAAFGLGTRFRRLLEIVVKHARHNRYCYRIADSREASAFDIALVDMTVSGGPELAGSLQKALNGRPVIRVGRRDDPTRTRDDLLHASFTARVLYTLNDFVEHHLLRPPASQTVRPMDPHQAVLDAGLLRRPRALIVDDSPTVRRQLAVALHQMNIDTEAVPSAQEALDVLDSRRYELAFVDVVMPEIDGYRLTRMIKRELGLRAMPVIILTSRSSPFDLARGALAGCNSYLVKPVSLQSLRDTVRRQLQRARARRTDDGELSLA